MKLVPHYSLVILTLYALLFALCQPSGAQQSMKVPRVGFLSLADSEQYLAGFRRGMRELGYEEGQNFLFEYRSSKGRVERFSEHAAELVRIKTDVIVAGGDPAVRAAKNATKTIPIVMVGVGADPAESGLVESLARPGGNVTGLTSFAVDTSGKRLELLKETVPKLARVAVLYDPAVPAARQVKDDLPVAARALGLTIQPWEIRAAEDFDRVFAALNKERPEGLYASSGLVITVNGKRVVDFALKNRLPSTYSVREAVDAGGLMYSGADLVDSYRRVATYMDRILKGAKPTDLPVEQPRKFEFIINLKTAKQIGLTIPPNVLTRADKVIK
jgi:putative tryptophan/tyrosine transport system substrate-binding protein